MQSRRIATLGLLGSVALVLGYVESLLPGAGVPGVKLGLANTVLLYAVYLLDAGSAWLLLALKVAGSLLYSQPFAALYGLAGGVCSLLVMLLFKKTLRGMSVVGVSVCGAAAHNIAQLAVARLITGTPAIFAYLPVLLVSAAVTGAATGLIARYALPGIRRAGRG